MSMTLKERLELGRAFKVRNENGESCATIARDVGLSRTMVQRFINVAIRYERSAPIGPLSGIWTLCYEGKISRHEAKLLQRSGILTMQQLKEAISIDNEKSPVSRKFFDILSAKRWEDIERIMNILESDPRKLLPEIGERYYETNAKRWGGALSEIGTLYYEGKIEQREATLLRWSGITTIQQLKEAIRVDKGTSSYFFKAFPCGCRIRWKELEKIVSDFEADTSAPPQGRC